MSERCETCIMVRTTLYNQPLRPVPGLLEGVKMKREWKPGDVAMTAKNTIALCQSNGRFVDVGGAPWSNDRFPNNLRPLVVIDPEDREQVERLMASLERMSFSTWACGALSCMQDALRELANPTPPKPDEPKGMGAVVEDAAGYLWVRAPKDGNPAWSEWVSSHSTCQHYDNIAAFRVLSEGVTP